MSSTCSGRLRRRFATTKSTATTRKCCATRRNCTTPARSIRVRATEGVSEVEYQQALRELTEFNQSVRVFDTLDVVLTSDGACRCAAARRTRGDRRSGFARVRTALLVEEHIPVQLPLVAQRVRAMRIYQRRFAGGIANLGRARSRSCCPAPGVTPTNRQRSGTSACRRWQSRTPGTPAPGCNWMPNSENTRDWISSFSATMSAAVAPPRLTMASAWRREIPAAPRL